MMIKRWVMPVVVTVLAGGLSLYAAVGPEGDSPESRSPVNAGHNGPDLSALFPSMEGAYPPPVAGSYALPPLNDAPDGLLLDQEGASHHLRPLLQGRISLVSFVYLLCGDAEGCPLAMSTLYEIYHTSAKAPALAEHVQLITISFDPERDTPQALKSFAYPLLADPERDAKIPWSVFTSPSEQAMQALTGGFGQVVDRRPDSEVVNHLLRMYLIDGRGRVRNIYGLGMIDPPLIMADVETLLIENGPGNPPPADHDGLLRTVAAGDVAAVPAVP